MKRIIFLLSILCCNGAYADTINLHWLNEDGTTYQNSTCVIDSDLILPSTPPTKYGYTFTGWKLATIYTRIEYIESTGTQYINPNINITGNLKFEFDITTSNITNDGIIGGNGCVDTGLVSIRKGPSYQPYFKFYRNSQTYTPCNVAQDTQRHLFVQDIYNNKIQIDNCVQDISVEWAGLSLPIYIGASTYCGGGPSIYWQGKFYQVKFYESGTLVRDLIPVLDNDGTPCMFDRVEGKFYYNQGTGQFIAGPVLNE